MQTGREEELTVEMGSPWKGARRGEGKGEAIHRPRAPPRRRHNHHRRHLGRAPQGILATAAARLRPRRPPSPPPPPVAMMICLKFLLSY